MQKLVAIFQVILVLLFSLFVSLLFSLVLIAGVGNLNDWDSPGAGFIILIVLFVAVGNGLLCAALCGEYLWTHRGRPERMRIFRTAVRGFLLILVGGDLLLPALCVPLTGPRETMRLVLASIGALGMLIVAAILIYLGNEQLMKARLLAGDLPFYLKPRRDP